jgi:hypothetical protein
VRRSAVVEACGKHFPRNVPDGGPGKLQVVWPSCPSSIVPILGTGVLAVTGIDKPLRRQTSSNNNDWLFLGLVLHYRGVHGY